MVCRGDCKYFKRVRPGYTMIERDDGTRVWYCAICVIFFEYYYRFCPCCGIQMSSRPKDRRLREKRLKKIEENKKELIVNYA